MKRVYVMAFCCVLVGGGGCTPAARAKTCTAYDAARVAACAACAELSARPCPFEEAE